MCRISVDMVIMVQSLPLTAGFAGELEVFWGVDCEGLVVLEMMAFGLPGISSYILLTQKYFPPI